MSKKNLPNIPIYIGDWERDCNVLSLESEMAWMKIIFKMHLLGKQSIYKTSTRGLQILWKSTAEKVIEIIEELRFNEICEIVDIAGGYEFLSRRIKKENELSQTRSEAVSSRYKPSSKPKKIKEEVYKPSTNPIQNTDNDIDYENDNESEKGKEGSGEKPKKPTTPKAAEPEVQMLFDSEVFLTQWKLWKVFREKEHKFKYKTAISEQAALNDLSKLAEGEENTAIAIIHQSIAKGWKGFFELKNNGKGKQSTSESKYQPSDDLKRKIAERLQSS